MNQLKRFVNSTICIRVFTISLNFISNILINRSLGIELKGQFTIIQNYANFLQLLLSLGVCYAYSTLKKEHGDKQAKNCIVSVIWLQTFIYLIISIIVFLIDPAIEKFFIVLLFIAMICNSQIVFIALIDNIRSRNWMLLSSTCVYILLNIIAIYFFPGNLYVIVGLLCIKYFYEICICSVKFHYFTFSFMNIKREHIRTILKMGIPTAALAVLISCNYNIDVFMLIWLGSGNIQVGVFGVAYSLSNMMWFIPDAFKEMIYNRTAKENDFRFVLKYIYINMFFCFCICIGFAVFGKWFLSVVYGKEYRVAFNVCLTLFIGIIPMVAFKLIHPIYVNMGRSLAVVILLLIAVVINVVLSYFLIPAYGAYGAAIASVISYSICGTLFFGKFYLDYCKVVS